jgi:pyruvate dehydrogenase E2 component (dihydrolipoamide acetyltransferase)
MIKEIIMPKLGETMEEGILSRWLKKEGEKVKRGEPLFEVVTDKATFESESTAEGYLRKIACPADAQKNVPVLQVIGYIADTMSEDVPSAGAVPKTAKEADPVQSAPRAEEKRSAVKTESDGFIKASPIAKRLAAERGVDLSLVTGTGPEGRIVEKDILSYAPGQSGIAGTDYTAVPLSPMRRTIAERLSRSKREIPHYYLQAEINMDKAAALREKLVKEAEKKGTPRVSYNDIVIYAAGKALAEYPEVNSNYMNGELRIFKDVNIGVAVALEQGLVVPVIRKVNGKSVEDIAFETKKLQEKAKGNKFLPDDFSGGTFTISNLGMFEVDSFSAIINPPQVGILAVGKVGKGMVFEGDNCRPGYIMKVTLSLDHRAVDGAYGAKFLKKLKEILQELS